MTDHEFNEKFMILKIAVTKIPQHILFSKTWLPNLPTCCTNIPPHQLTVSKHKPCIIIEDMDGWMLRMDIHIISVTWYIITETVLNSTTVCGMLLMAQQIPKMS